MISVIAPAYNNPEEVRKLLESVALSRDASFPFEVIIVDDGSRDHSIKDVVAEYGFARYVRTPENDGAAAARNMGARESRYDSLFFVDSDVVMLPDTLAASARYFSDPGTEAFVGHFSTTPVNAGFFPRYKAIMFNSWLPKEGYSTIFTPAIGGVRKDIFFASGGFDETIKGATVEYVKFSYELRKRCEILFCRDVVVKVKLNTFGKALYTDFYSTMKWVTIFSRYRKFDNHCTSVAGGAGRLFGFITLISFPVCVIYGLYTAWLAAGAVYLILNRRFFIMVIKETGSPVFFIRSILTHLVLSTVTVLGGVAGLAMVIAQNISRPGRQAS